MINRMKLPKPFLIMAVLQCMLTVSAFGQATTIKTFEYAESTGIFNRYCSSCHEWAGSYEGLIDSTMVIPGNPGKSPALTAIEAGTMPQSGPLLTAEEKTRLFDWILSGAPKPELPATDAVAGATAEADSTVAGGTVPAPTFFGFKNRTEFHRASGWTSAGLLLAAGAVGAYRALDMQAVAHAYRDDLGIDEDEIGSQCAAEIQSAWSANQAIRWTHVGLLAAGESVYLMDAITGIGFMGPGRPGISKYDLHRWAFFTHGGLMMAEVVLGFITTDALKNGDHELVSSLGVAHAAIGLAIPTVMIAAGAVMDFF